MKNFFPALLLVSIGGILVFAGSRFDLNTVGLLSLIPAVVAVIVFVGVFVSFWLKGKKTSITAE